jgi:hypothetical protein
VIVGYFCFQQHLHKENYLHEIMLLIAMTLINFSCMWLVPELSLWSGLHIISRWICLQQDFGQKNCLFGITFVYCNKFFLLSLLLHFLYCCICFFPFQQLLFLQLTEHIFHNYLLLIFMITYPFQLLLLSISKVQISLVTFYFSPYVTGMLFQLVLNYL